MKTTWMRIPTFIWIDPITKKARTIENQLIEIVLVEEGKFLIQDEPSGTHRTIPVENFLLATMEKP